MFFFYLFSIAEVFRILFCCFSFQTRNMNDICQIIVQLLSFDLRPIQWRIQFYVSTYSLRKYVSCWKTIEFPWKQLKSVIYEHFSVENISLSWVFRMKLNLQIIRMDYILYHRSSYDNLLPTIGYIFLMIYLVKHDKQHTESKTFPFHHDFQFSFFCFLSCIFGTSVNLMFSAACNIWCFSLWSSVTPKKQEICTSLCLEIALKTINYKW